MRSHDIGTNVREAKTQRTPPDDVNLESCKSPAKRLLGKIQVRDLLLNPTTWENSLKSMVWSKYVIDRNVLFAACVVPLCD